MSPIMRLALPALAVASTAYAACTVSGTTTLQNQGDATGLATCTRTFAGSIAIATGTTENIALNNIPVIQGNLIVSNVSQLKSFSGDSLEEITGSLTLNDVQNLDTVTFPKLTKVTTIEIVAAPNLQAPTFGPITEAETIHIENTQIQTLDSIDLVAVDEVNIVNNRYITSIEMQLDNITTALTIGGNNEEVNVSFPQLTSANNMTYRNCSSVSIPSLKTLNGSMGLYGNMFTNFAAPNLTSIGGALALVSNTELTNISFPQLTEVKFNLEVANNTQLHEITGFPKLKSIGGALDFNGNITKVEMPSLSDVQGAFNLQSTGDIQQTCDEVFKPLADKDKIQGEYFCQGSVANPGGEGTTPTVTGGNAQRTGNAASSLVIDGNALGLMGLAAAFLL